MMMVLWKLMMMMGIMMIIIKMIIVRVMKIMVMVVIMIILMMMMMTPQVFLVRKIRGADRGQLYAMKVLKKATLKGKTLNSLRC